ncbi:MAG: hypothetical protein HY402_06090 [Elusimicrobia bacterium]|nr:hypothetical protein [Elusimicrobiota bacterium]
MSSKNLVVTGNPGCGKTTLIREAVGPFRDRVGGFFTEEIRRGSQRMGFVLKTFQGQGRLFASKALPGPPRFNKYGVDLKALRELAIPELEEARRGEKILVMDEIGSMEILSAEFRKMVWECLQGPCPVLASIRLRSQPFTDSLKALPQTELVLLERKNFALVKERVRQWLQDKVGR